MTKNNKTENLGNMRKLQNRCENWKNRALKYSRKYDASNHRIKEIDDSRNNWKEKYYALKKEHEALKKSIELNKNNSNEKVKHHSYPLAIILFVISLRSSSSVSLRGVQKVLKVFNKVFGFD